MFYIVENNQLYKDGKTFPTLVHAQEYLISALIEDRVNDLETNPEATTILFSGPFSSDLGDVKRVMRAAFFDQFAIHPLCLYVGKQLFEIREFD
jgi:hypothetical protein